MSSNERIGLHAPAITAPRPVWGDSDFPTRVQFGVVDVQLERLPLVRLDQCEQVLRLQSMNSGRRSIRKAWFIPIAESLYCLQTCPAPPPVPQSSQGKHNISCVSLVITDKWIPVHTIWCLGRGLTFSVSTVNAPSSSASVLARVPHLVQDGVCADDVVRVGPEPGERRR